MPEPAGPVTLGDLVREDKLLWVYCNVCCHERDVNPATVPLPPGTPVPEVQRVPIEEYRRAARALSGRHRGYAATLEAKHKPISVVIGEGAEAGSTCACAEPALAQRPG